MHSLETVTIASSFGFAGLLVLVVALFAAVLKYAGRVLYALGPAGVLILFLLVAILPIFPSAVLGSDVGFVIPLIVIMSMFAGWLIYVAGNPNYTLGANHRHGSTGEGELDIDGIDRNDSRITQEDSSRNVQPRWK